MFTTNKQQKIPLEGKMKTEKIKEILLERRDKLTDIEKEWTEYYNRGWYDRYLIDYTDQTYSDDMWQGFWNNSAFGQSYHYNQSLAKKFLSSEKKMNHVMDMMDDRKHWYSSGTQSIKKLLEEGKLTQGIVAFMISSMRKNNLHIFEGYVRDPIFDTGAIVQFRSNIAVDAILKEHTWSTGKNYYGADKSTLRELKGKTMMVLGECPPLGGKVYATSYAYKEKQGGSRYYRVLPVGDTKVYIVVEKFLKKCRTKAVKDAKK
jgi:hypothetical protein